MKRDERNEKLLCMMSALLIFLPFYLLVVRDEMRQDDEGG
jgi:hypothetical protein